MRVLIVTDLEGVSCVDNINMIPETNEGYKRACEYLMADTNAAIDGAFAGGATEVYVLDGHGGGRNFIPGQLDPRAVQISSEEYCHGRVDRYDALMCVGAHAMAGTVKAFLDHTEDSTCWFEYCLNGVPCGEMGLEAYIAGAFGLPFIMASGDAAACREAEALVPGIATACVKTAQFRNEADCLPLEEATALIREAAKEGVLRAPKIAPCVLSLPAEVKVTYTRNDYCDHLSDPNPTVKRNGRVVTKTVDKIETFFDLFLY